MAYSSYHTATSNYQATGSRYVGIGLVIILHIIIIWALVYALARRDIEFAPQDVQVSNIEQQKNEEKPPPPPPPKFEQPPPPYVPPPEINVAAPAPTNTTAIAVVTNRVAPPPPPPSEHKVTAQPKLIRAGMAEPEYPAISKRLGEEGTVVLAVLVGTDGTPQDAKIVTSSSYPRLDEAALNFAKRQRFQAGTVDDQPAPTWYTYKYRFNLLQ